MYRSKPGLFFLLLAVAVGCNLNELKFNNLELQDLRPTVVAPLGTAEYTMRELIEELDDDLLTTGADEDQVIILSYTDSTTFSVAEDFIKIDDVDGDGEILPNQEITATTTIIRIPFEKEFVYVYDDTEEERLDSVFYDNGLVKLNVFTTCECDFTYNFVIENTRNIINDSPLVFSGDIVFTGAGASTDQKEASLADHKTVLNNNANNFTSVFKGEIILKPGQTLRIDDSFSFDFIYSEQDFDQIFGYFGRDTISIEGGNIALELFDEAISDGIIFRGPTIALDVHNKFGIPIGLLTDSIYGVSASGDSVFLSGSVPGTPQTIAFNRDNIYEGAQTDISINTNNSNIRNLFNLPPNIINFPITGISNVNNPDDFNYVTDSSEVDINYTFTLPLVFRLDDYTQEIGFDIKDAYDIEEIDSLFIRIVTRNDLPFITSMTVRIIDDDEVELYTAPQKIVIELPDYNARGEIVRKSETVTTIDLGESGVEALKNGSRLSIALVLNSPGNNINEFFNVLITNSISVEVGIGGKGLIEL
ncbi:MAG: hypothetical protein WBA74_18125 [Cyclobacteriaceae bacterium]